MVLKKLQPTEDLLDARLNEKQRDDADILVNAIFRPYKTAY